MRGLVQILAVGSILLILLRAPDWTSLFLPARDAVELHRNFRATVYMTVAGIKRPPKRLNFRPLPY